MITSHTWVYDVEVARNYFGVTYIPLKADDENYNRAVEIYKSKDRLLQNLLVSNPDSSDIPTLIKDKADIAKALNFQVYEIYSLYDKDGTLHQHSDLAALVSFYTIFKNQYGYNSNNYDKEILKFVLDAARYCSLTGTDQRTGEHITTAIYKHSQEVIGYGKGFGNIKFRKETRYRDFDIQKILYLDKTFTSLKQVAICLRWYRIQTLPFAYDAYLKLEDLYDVRDYNINDVLITRELILNQIKEVRLREELSEEFGVDLYNESRSSISNKLLAYYYGRFTGLENKDFINLRTERAYVRLSDIVSNRISFETDILNNLLRDIKQKTIVVGSDIDEHKLKFECLFDNTVYTIGVGGLHSQDKPALFSDDDGHIYMDADVTSYYPNGMLMLDVYPRHLARVPFRACIGYFKDTRVKAKDEGNMTKAEGLKITINAAYGKLKDKYSFLYDPKCTYTVTVNLQLFLLMLIEKLSIEGIQCISANTDGIVCKFTSDQKDTYERVCKEWEVQTSFRLEYAQYEKYIRNDVNNYIAIKKGFKESLDSKKIKHKGLFIDEPVFNKGYNAPVIAKALNAYFIYGHDYREFIRTYIERVPFGIYDFCISQKANSSFEMVLKSIRNGVIVEETIQHSNRFYITTNKTKTVVKCKNDSDTTLSIVAKVGVEIFNNYVERDDYDIDYSFYINECSKIVEGSNKHKGYYRGVKGRKAKSFKDDGIEKKQLSLW